MWPRREKKKDWLVYYAEIPVIIRRTYSAVYTQCSPDIHTIDTLVITLDARIK